MNVVVIGLSHHTSPVELRERFAFGESKILPALAELRGSGIASEGVIVSTCNRVEIYAATALPSSKAFSELTDFLVRAGGAALAPAPQSIYTLAEPHSLRHLFKVACGLDSMVLGETEIFGQLKDAYALAHSHKHTGARLNKAFQRAFNAAKHVRTHTQIQRGSVSVASVAVELAEKIFSAPAERAALVLGAGEMSEKVARTMVSRGVKNIMIAGRSLERAELLAVEFGGRAVQFDNWMTHLENVDIVISSTSAPNYVLNRQKLEPLMKLRRHRRLLLIDIAVPRDIDPDVNFLENVYLYNIDDLEAIADDYLKQRKEEVRVCEGIVDERVKALVEAWSPTGGASSIGEGPNPKVPLKNIS
ncbi:MAG: glutamyl-tRNA reductase [Limisphaerales bacterium]